MAKKSVLVTGASGFLGRPLVERLLDAGYSVRAASRTSKPFPKSVDVAIIPDLRNSINWKPILSGINIVIHMAGMAHADTRDEASSDFDLINRVATQDLANAAKNEGIERFVYLSSVRAQTGASNKLIVRESDGAHPTNEYGRTKLAAEFAVQASGVPFTILRPVAIYGPNLGGNIKELVRLAGTFFPLPLGGLTSRRSLLGLGNFISVILFVLDTPATVGETYLVANSAPLRISEIVAIVRKARQRPPLIFYAPPATLRFGLTLLNLSRLWERLGEDLIVDTSKLQAAGWRPIADSYEGIVAMMRAENDARPLKD